MTVQGKCKLGDRLAFDHNIMAMSVSTGRDDMIVSVVGLFLRLDHNIMQEPGSSTIHAWTYMSREIKTRQALQLVLLANDAWDIEMAGKS